MVVCQDINDALVKKFGAMPIRHSPMDKFGSKSMKGWMLLEESENITLWHNVKEDIRDL